VPLKNGKTTPQERIFAERYAATGDRDYAARKAGYKAPSVSAAQNLARPAIQAEIARVQTAKLFQDALPAAVECLVSLVKSSTAPAGARVQAAKVILDRTLGADGAREGKEPHEMSAEELAQAIERLKREAAERAKPAVLELEALEVPEPAEAPETSLFD
jgi:phage terminase small subunit